MAVTELFAFAATGRKSKNPHRYTFLDQRVNAIRETLTERRDHPKFAVFYGTNQRAVFSDIVGGF